MQGNPHRDSVRDATVFTNGWFIAAHPGSGSTGTRPMLLHQQKLISLALSCRFSGGYISPRRKPQRRRQVDVTGQQTGTRKHCSSERYSSGFSPRVSVQARCYLYKERKSGLRNLTAGLENNGRLASNGPAADSGSQALHSRRRRGAAFWLPGTSGLHENCSFLGLKYKAPTSGLTLKGRNSTPSEFQKRAKRAEVQMPHKHRSVNRSHPPAAVATPQSEVRAPTEAEVQHFLAGSA